VVEGTRLLIWHTGNRIGGSNPPLSANESLLYQQPLPQIIRTAGAVAFSAVKQHRIALVTPGRLVGNGERIKIRRRGDRVVNPLPQDFASID
jgi:hypothetical protein